MCILVFKFLPATTQTEWNWLILLETRMLLSNVGHYVFLTFKVADLEDTTGNTDCIYMDFSIPVMSLICFYYIQDVVLTY